MKLEIGRKGGIREGNTEEAFIIRGKEGLMKRRTEEGRKEGRDILRRFSEVKMLVKEERGVKKYIQVSRGERFCYVFYWPPQVSIDFSPALTTVS